MSKKLKNADYQTIHVYRDGKYLKRRVIVDNRNKLIAYGTEKTWLWIHSDFRDERSKK